MPTKDFGQSLINFTRWLCINGKTIGRDRLKLSVQEHRFPHQLIFEREQRAL
ncbi:hypothetical protein [Nostoc sp.]|uniref:hypothetical protein n=1 Tax=Nostoc sp. TaxID=1180 RepID=UPI002FFA4AF4